MSSLAARSDFPTEGLCTWSRQPSRVGPAQCCLLSSMRVPSTHGKPLAGCLGAQSATMPPTSGLPDCQSTPSTAGHSSSIILHCMSVSSGLLSYFLADFISSILSYSRLFGSTIISGSQAVGT